MIHLVVALPAEAKPIIRHYQLKRVSSLKHFSVYRSEDVFLILSGVGRANAQEAVACLHECAASPKNSIWLNVGIAGHREYPLGTGVLAHKIIDRQTDESWYPPILFKPPCPTASILTVDRPEAQYSEPLVYEMEASGFYDAATQYSTAELIHCFKVISDNRKTSPWFAMRRAERLMTNHLETIDAIVQSLKALASSLPTFSRSDEDIEVMTKRWHFTVTERHQLKRLLERLRTLEPEGVILDGELKQLRNAGEVLHFLEHRIDSLPVRFSFK